MTVWRCWLLSAMTGLLMACASSPSTRSEALPVVQPHPVCDGYVDAWVGHFRANVDSLNRNGAALTSPTAALVKARAQLREADVDAGQCALPYCVVQPLAGGQLDSYCGYRVPDPSGRELYRWIPHR